MENGWSSTSADRGRKGQSCSLHRIFKKLLVYVLFIH
jgi:hypothetical protein